MSLHRDLFVGSGRFDSSFSAAKHEDIEFAYRLSTNGAVFHYEEKALGYHIFSKNTQAALYDAYIEGKSANYLVLRYPEL